MSSDLAVKIEGLCKSYTLFKSPSDRLVQMIQAFASRFVAWRPLHRYREFHALKDVSLSIAKGETVGIIGRNGSGKSTLLQLLCGTLQPTRGSVNVSGRVAALLELGSGFHPDFTGRENVFLNASVLGLSRAQTMDRFEQIVAFADIGDFIDQPLKNYSSGMAMRLAFAVIAHVDADILVIDEALSVGDAFFTQKCMRFLRTFMKSGTVIFVSHDIEAVKALCSRVVWLDAGLVRDDGATKLVCQGYLDALLIGKSGLTEQPPISPIKITKEVLSHQDVRQNLWREKSLANNICVMAFDSDESGIGKMGCTIVSVKLCNVDESPAAWFEGGELVRLNIKAVCHQALTSPIFGFMVKDRTGQALFGDNTWFSFMDRPLSADVGEVLTAAFTFEMPRLPAGDYTMVAAVVDGTPQENVMHHWLHDALHFQSVASNVASGLVGIPMRKITISKVVPDLEKAK